MFRFTNVGIDCRSILIFVFFFLLHIYIGIRLATIQIKQAIVEMVQNFHITVDAEKSSEPFTLNPNSFMVLPTNGLWINLRQL